MGINGYGVLWVFVGLSCCLTTYATSRMEFSISKQWDGGPLDHDSINIQLSQEGDFVIMGIHAPYFHDPKPNGEAGKPFPKLWDYEVVEAFFLGSNTTYLEVEFSPHGEHLILFLAGHKNAIKMCLPVEYSATIKGYYWTGRAKIPVGYFPPNIQKFNAYAIHGTGEGRTYEALYPVPSGMYEHPDFHRLEYFQEIKFDKLVSREPGLSDVWKEALKNSGGELVCDGKVI